MEGRGTPAEFLLNIASSTIQKRWRALQKAGSLAQSSVSDLRTAFTYLTGLAHAEAEDQSESIRRNPYLWEGSSRRDTSLEHVSDSLGTIVLLAAVAAISGFFEVSGGHRDLDFIFLVPVIVPLLARLLGDLFIDRTFLNEPLTVEGLRSDRLTILAVLSESSTGAFSGGGLDSESEAVREMDTALPAPPGITEIVLEAAPTDVFKDIRSHLLSVRRYHNVVLWALILAFMTFFGFLAVRRG